ncbi:MAG: glycosyltransferase family 9 protein [Candidatus Brocadiaceae bacterium]
MTNTTYSPLFEPPIKHVLIIRPGALGDGIVTLPTMLAIREYFPDARIEIMGSANFLEIVKGRFYADSVSRFDHVDVAALFTQNTHISPSLLKRFGKKDVIILFVPDQDQILTNNLKASGAGYVIQYDPFPSPGESIHIIDHFLHFLDLIGIPSFSKTPKIFLNGEDVFFADNFLHEKIIGSKKTLIAIHPGSGGRQKCWPVERYAALIGWLKKEMDAEILVISGPADDHIVKELRVKVGGNFIFADQLPLSKLASLIKRCNLFVGNDSGITHMAAALGTRTVAIFGPTDPGVWGPRGDSVKILYRQASCSPCAPEKRRNCEVQICLEYIVIDDVIRAVECSNL